MKKLLSLLGVITIASSSIPLATASGIISYGSGTSSWVKRMLNADATISAEVMKSGILADQKLIFTDNKNVKNGMAMDYTTEYFGNRSAKKVFGNNVYNPKQGANVDDSTKVADVYGSFFGNDYDSKFKDLVKTSVKTKNLDGLSSFFSNPNQFDDLNKKLAQPDSNVAKILGVIAGGGSIVFKNDWDSSIASIITGVLKTNMVKSKLDDDSIKKTIASIDNILNPSNIDDKDKDKYNLAVDNLINTINQSKYATDEKSTVGNKLTTASQELARGLIYLLSQKQFVYDKPDLSNAPTALWNLIINKKTDGLTPVTHSENEKSDINLVNSITDFVDFGFSTLHYIKMFRAEIDGTITKQDISRKNITKVNQLFSSTVSNENVVQKINSLKYGPHNGKDFKELDNSLWTTQVTAKDKVYSAKANIQNFFSELEYYFSSSSNGYNILSILNILLNSNSSIRNTLINDSLAKILNKKVSDLINPIISNIPLNDIKTKIQTLLGTAPELVINSVIDWIINDGQIKDQSEEASKEQTIIGIIDSLVSLFNGINLSTITSFLPPVNPNDAAAKKQREDLITYIKLAKGIASAMIATNMIAGNDNDRPWTAIYSNSLIGKIGRSLMSSYPALGTDIIGIGSMLNKFSSLKKVLSGTTINEIISILNNSKIIKGTTLKIPDWLYDAKTMTVSGLIKSISENFNKDSNSSFAYATLQQNNKLIVDMGALSGLVESLRATSDDEFKTNHNMQIVDEDTKQPVGLLAALINIVLNKKTGDSCSTGYSNAYMLNYYDKDGKLVNNEIMSKTTGTISTAVDLLFGLDGTSFIKGSLFYGMSRLYGQNFDGISADEKLAMSNGVKSIFSMLSWASNFANSSITDLTNDKYMRYLDDRRWRISNEWQSGLDKDGVDQHVGYTLSFFNPDDSIWYHYDIEFVRSGDVTNREGFVLTKLIRQN